MKRYGYMLQEDGYTDIGLEIIEATCTNCGRHILAMAEDCHAGHDGQQVLNHACCSEYDSVERVGGGWRVRIGGNVDLLANEW